MAQNELDDKLRSILTDVSNPMKVNINQAIASIKLLFEDERLEGLEQQMVTRRKENLETSSQLTLGELIAKLEKVPDKDLPVIIAGSIYHPSGLSSWRGSYDELAIEYDSDGEVSLSDFLEMLKVAVGKSYEGYKGGSYKMRLDTPLWVAHYGTAVGFRIGDDGNDYQAVSGVVWNEKYVNIDTDCLEY